MTATSRNVAEYAMYEAKVLADGEAVRGFVSDVDGLREDLDRLEARLAMLEKQA
jgi:ubiquinone biosynthesis protein UbiJ